VKALSADAIALAAKTIRVLTVDAVRQAGIGHVGLPLGCAELATVLFGEILRHDPADPGWPDRDRFVLSAGHGSMLLYALLHLSGYRISIDDIRRFRQLGSITPGHPEHRLAPGVECTTGPLGQGFGNAVGMALAERMLAVRLGSDLVDHRTYVLASDGDMMEGVASEAASLAGHLGLGRLIVLYDDNSVTIDGPTSLTFSEDVPLRFRAYGWDVQRVDGHDPDAVRQAIQQALESEERPHLIACKTHIGLHSPAVDSAAAHGAIGDDATERTRLELGWTLPPFIVPEQARAVFLANADRGRELRLGWERRKASALRDPQRAARWTATIGGRLAPELPTPEFPEKALATRLASGRFLGALGERTPALVTGSADLSGSTSTLAKQASAVARGSFEGSHVHFGVREHCMGAVANGLALHGGLRPCVGTFLVFSDYMRPPLRLAAMTGIPVVFVFTHDSIFVGEDGPTHQPVEQLAALRAIPKLEVWRPADARETVVAWRESLARSDGPAVLALTRQNVPVLQGEGIEEGARRGGYIVLREAGAQGPELVIVGTGSETHLAAAAAGELASQGVRVRAVSIPCLERFLAQAAAYQQSVLPDAVPRLVVEAGVDLGVAKLLRPGDRFHGMQGFGASAPFQDLARHFGFTPEAIVKLARQMLV
jgi:transketolase